MTSQQGIGSTIAAALWTVFFVAFPGGARAAEPVVQPALDGVFAAFETHPLVGIGDQHMLANELEFYGAIVRDPRFAATVGNVVAEFGAPQHQGILDRYVAGEHIDYGELSNVWRDTVGANPTILGVGYLTFFAQVRAANSALQPEQRIRILLSEPPIDWDAVKSKEDWQRVYDQREPHIAGVIVREVLDRKKKALVIYGVGHFHSFPWPSTLPLPSSGLDTMREIVERQHPNAFYVIQPYTGFEKPGCAAALEASMQWPRNVLIAPVRGTPLETALMRQDCMIETLRGVVPLPPADELARLRKRVNEIETGVAADALLYLAPEAELMRTPSDPSTWMDLDYLEEMGRRIRLRGNTPLPFPDLVNLVAAPPRPWRQR